MSVNRFRLLQTEVYILIDFDGDYVYARLQTAKCFEDHNNFLTSQKKEIKNCQRNNLVKDHAII